MARRQPYERGRGAHRVEHIHMPATPFAVYSAVKRADAAPASETEQD